MTSVFKNRDGPELTEQSIESKFIAYEGNLERELAADILGKSIRAIT